MNDAHEEQRLNRLESAVAELRQLIERIADQRPALNVQEDVTRPSPPQRTSEAEPLAAAPQSGSVLLSEFLQLSDDLAPSERLQLVDVALGLLDDVFVHLDHKKSMYAIDPLQRLRLLGSRLKEEILAETVETSARGFHDEMIRIFHSLRDLHTNYLLPQAYQGRVAFLPFLVQEYYTGDPRRREYVVTRVLPQLNHATFVVGVNITHWNGIPIDRAVELNAAREAGSNPEAAHARGLESLTIRSLRLSAPPDEDWVVVGYRTDDGQALEERFAWRVTSPPAAPSGADAEAATSFADAGSLLMGFDAQAVVAQRAKKSLFFPAELLRESRMAAAWGRASAGQAADQGAGPPNAGPARVFLKEGRSGGSGPRGAGLAEAERSLADVLALSEAAASGDSPDTTSLLPDFFSFRKVNTSQGEFGYVRIFSFMATNHHQFVAEFVRILGLLPNQGLIIDVRGNGGGNILAGELILQTLTGSTITPERFQFINSPGVQKLVDNHEPLVPWRYSVNLAVQSGERYSQGFPLTPPEQANAIGRKYQGPVVLVVDALCYSTTDIFAAGFQDHGIGSVLGAAGRTGAGGANVWTYNAFQDLSWYQGSLPKGASFRAAVRRSVRVGPNEGLPLEDFGVAPDQRHYMTRKDVLEANVDLIEAAAQLLTTGAPAGEMPTVPAPIIRPASAERIVAPAGAAASATERRLVYVHGICRHEPGFSDAWWAALRPHLPSNLFGPGLLGQSRLEVVWSDIVNARGAALVLEAALTAGSGNELATLSDREDLIREIRSTLRSRVDESTSASSSAALGAGSPSGELAGTISIPGVSCLDDFASYLISESVRQQILDRFLAVVRPELSAGRTLDIISHSWGTVVAYEGLRQLADEGLTDPGVRNLFTVGAALSIAPVRARLRPLNRDGRKPANTCRWINLDAQGDVVGGPLKGNPYAVDTDFVDLQATGCRSIVGIVSPQCAHSSYFDRHNTAVNRGIFAEFIQRT